MSSATPSRPADLVEQLPAGTSNLNTRPARRERGANWPRRFLEMSPHLDAEIQTGQLMAIISVGQQEVGGFALARTPFSVAT